MKRLILPLLLFARVASAQDMIPPASITNVSTVQPDALSLPMGGTISRVTMSPESGWAFECSCRSTWPDVLVFGNDGYLEYTVWPVAQINGQWITTGEVQMWRDRPSTGGFGEPTWSADFPANWGYNAPFLRDYHPQPGQSFGFFLTAGSARHGTGLVTSVRERSNIVVVTLPQGDRGEWSFNASPPPVPSDPLPPVVTPPQNSGDVDALLELIGELDAKLSAIQAQQAKDRADVLALVAQLSQDVDEQKPSAVGSVIKNILLALGAIGAGVGAAK